MHPAAPHGEIDAVDRLQAAEIFGEPLHFEAIGAPESAGAARAARRRGGGGARAASEQPSDEAPDAVGHEDHDQNDGGAVDREIEARHALEEAQPFGDEDQQAGADRRADRRGDAAEQRHRQQHDRIGEGELIGAHIGKTACEQSAAEAAEHRAQSAKAITLVRKTSMPAALAASSLSRTARIARPSRVFGSRQTK